MSAPHPEELVKSVADQIIGGMKMAKSPQQAAADLIGMGVPAELAQAGLERVLQRAADSRALRIPDSLVDREILSDAWYTGSTSGDRFWPALELALRETQMPGTAIESIDGASRKIVGYLAPPWDEPIRTRGLVLGHVQSGKTSNFTAVIAKAADAGYRMFVVLSGVHNNLRRQTQIRLDEQLIEASRSKWGEGNWLPLTSATGDFARPETLFDPDVLLTTQDRWFLAVVKKNGGRLENLVHWLESASEATLGACPLLVIDDEADQASVNTARELDERTKINSLLVRLLSVPKAAYIGYTATPFANLFVDPSFPGDVYPRDFIVDLPASADYFGPDRVFGRERLEHDDDEPDDGLDVIRRIEVDDLVILQPPRARADRDAWKARIPPSLEAAFRYFILATAARRCREDPTHSTMLVHTTSLTSVHLRYEAPFNDLRDALGGAIRARDPGVLGELRDFWARECAAVPADSLGETTVSFEQLEPHLEDVVGEMEIVIDNYRSLQRLHYGDTPQVVVVIGGNTLSRGLTLEGLVVSYFARSTNAYDTLLQMGRWFGYRRGYPDLPRIWLSETIEEWFRHLATVEAELRVDVGRYEDDGVTPTTFGARIRTHPQLAITSAMKMRHARPIKVSYSGRRLQTILFHHRDREWLLGNKAAASSLVRAAVARGIAPEDIGLGRWLVQNVDVGPIKVFLDEYRFHENAVELQRDLVLNYIEEQNRYDDLLRWNVAVMGSARSKLGTVNIGLPDEVGLINRARMDTTKPYADIKALMSKPDRVVDLNLSSELLAGKNDEQLQDLRPPGTGLLLLYPVSRNSTPSRSETRRVDLEAAEDMIGVGMVFPDVPQSRGWSQVDYVSVDLSRVEETEAEDEEDWEDQEELELALAGDDEEDFVPVSTA